MISTHFCSAPGRMKVKSAGYGVYIEALSEKKQPRLDSALHSREIDFSSAKPPASYKLSALKCAACYIKGKLRQILDDFALGYFIKRGIRHVVGH